MLVRKVSSNFVDVVFSRNLFENLKKIAVFKLSERNFAIIIPI